VRASVLVWVKASLEVRVGTVAWVKATVCGLVEGVSLSVVEGVG
jgi:hypothetical protein